MGEGTDEAGWNDLIREFDAWQAEGWTATLWWRDDDATEVTGALEKMLEISDSTKTPLAVAVIPARAGSALRDRLSCHHRVDVLQHGFAHVNNEPEGGKKSEFGISRDAGQVNSEIRRGRDILSGWRPFLPVFVPPWNRIDTRFLDVLPALGFRGISCFNARQAHWPVPGLVGANTHIDIIQKRDGERRFIGVGPAISALVKHLSSRRLGLVDRREPSGMLSHHLDHDSESWLFLEHLFRLVGNHSATRWLTASEVFKGEIEQKP